GPCQTVSKGHHRFATDGRPTLLVGRLVGVGRFFDRAGASALHRQTCCSGGSRAARRGAQGARSNTTIRAAAGTNRAITLSAGRGGLSTKIHAVVDGRGRPLVILLTPGLAGDAPMMLPLLAGLRVGRPLGRPRTRPDRVLADKAYCSRAIRTHLRARGI